MIRLHTHPGSLERHAATLRHSDPPSYAGHSTEVARWRTRRGHKPTWAQNEKPGGYPASCRTAEITGATRA